MSTLRAHQEISPARLRATLRSFATGVTVVTSAGDGEPCGMTVNAFTSVSLEPALVLVCLGADSATTHAIERHGVFAVNVLSARQQWLSRRFSAPDRPRGHDAFAGVAHRTGSTGAPILDGAASWLDCRLQAIHPAGDHVIALGEVLDLAGEARREPLLFHDGRYRIVRDADRAPRAGRGAVGLAPDVAELYQNRALALGDLGREDEAARDLGIYLRLAPDAEDRAAVEDSLALLGRRSPWRCLTLARLPRKLGERRRISPGMSRT